MTPIAIHWQATGYGVVVAFAAASSTPCAGDGSFELAYECRNATRHGKSTCVAALENVQKIDPFADDERFDDALAHLDLMTFDVVLSPEAFAWLRAALAAQPASAAFAAARIRMKASLDAARTESFVATEKP